MGSGPDAELCRLAELAASFAAEHLAADARALAERVAEGRFFVACVGQFKRGKSTLLNALVGEPVLPTGIIPVTAVPTVLRYGEQPSARIRSANGDWTTIALKELAEYVSEERNPENTKAVAGVEVFLPSPLLASGMCFVDTPGLGSVFAGNTAATRDFIPHIDAALVIIGADPPISGEELGIVETVARQVDQLLFVLNKADRASERERAESGAFAHRLLQARLPRPVGTIYEVSASERLQGSGPERDWGKLVAELTKLADESGQTLTAAARQRGLRRLTSQLLSVVREEREALLRPVEESEHRIASMRSTMADAERSLLDLAYLFIAEQHRLSRVFADRRTEFLNSTSPSAHEELATALCALGRRTGPRYRRAAMRAAQSIARSELLPWLQMEEAFAEQAFREIAQRFVDIGNDFLKRLSQAGVQRLADTPRPLEVQHGFRTRSRFYFQEFIEVAQPASPLRLLADTVLGLFGAYAPIVRDAHNFLDRLLEANTMRVQSDVDQRVRDAKSRLETDLRILLHEVTAVAERALRHARAARDQGSAAISDALTRIAATEAKILTHSR
jgi:hypothetical protein